MIGIIDLSWIGIIVGGGLIALIMYNLPYIKALTRHPLLALILGIFIAYLLDDYSEQMTKGDIIVSILTIIILILMLYPIIRDLAKGRKKVIQKLQEKVGIIERKISNIDGKIETILNLYPRKKK